MRLGPDASPLSSSGGVPARTSWEETQARWRLYPCYRQRLGVLPGELEEERISAVPNQGWRNTREEGKEPLELVSFSKLCSTLQGECFQLSFCKKQFADLFFSLQDSDFCIRNDFVVEKKVKLFLIKFTSGP